MRGSSHDKGDVMNINRSHACYFEQSLDINQVRVFRLSSIVVILTLALSFIYLLSSPLVSIILSIINSFVVLLSTLLPLFLDSSGIRWRVDHTASPSLGWSRKTSRETQETGRIYTRHASSESARTEAYSC